MISLSFEFEYNYRPLDADEGALNQPAIPLTLTGPSDELDTVALIDSGARGCLFKGELAPLIGIKNIMSGRRERCYGLGGGGITGYFHKIRIRFDGSDFPIEAGFTMDEISYNILGQSFLAFVQFGLRDYHQKLYLTPSP